MPTLKKDHLGDESNVDWRSVDMKWIDRHQRIHLFQMMDLATATCWLSRNWKRMKAWALSLSFSFIWANSRGSKIPFFNWGLWAPIEDCWLRQVPNQEASDQGLIDFSFHHLIAIKWRDEKKSILNPWFEDLLNTASAIFS